MPQYEIGALQEALGSVREEMAEHNDLVKSQNERLARVEAKLPNFVQKRRFWWVVGGVVLLVAIVVAFWWFLRAQDHREADRRRDAIVFAQQQDLEWRKQDRESSIRGCERNNEFRAAFRRVIERAYAPQPIPDGLPQDILDLYLAGQARQAEQREAQLRDPGVQPVDCQVQFPPIPEPINEQG